MYAETRAQFDEYSLACRWDMRLIGLILLELCFHRPLSDYEKYKFKNLDKFTTKELKEVLFINRYPEPLRKLFEICFQPMEYDEFKVGRKFGSRLVSASLSYGRELRKVYFNIKDNVQLLFHDFPPSPKKMPFWLVIY